MLHVIVGIVSGLVSGMGMGGGTILILCLSLFLGVEQHTAQGANLIFFIPTSLTSIITNMKQKLIKWKTGLIVAGFGSIGAVIRCKNIDRLGYQKAQNIFWDFLINYCRCRDNNFFQKEKRK